MKPGILFVGNFLGSQMGTTGISELLSDSLRSRNWHIITTSSQTRSTTRLADMVWNTWSQRNNYSIAHVDVFSGKAFVWAEVTSKLLKRLQKPYMLTLRGGNLPSFARRWPRRILSLLSAANVVTSSSHYLIEELKPFREDIRYLPNGLDLQNYPFVLRDHPQPKLCWLRAFHNIYNPSLAVEALSMLKEEFPDIHLTMIGPDKADGSFDKVSNFLESTSLETHVTFTGAIPKHTVSDWLGKFDIFLNTTQFESFGVAVMEAAAVGLPIVSTDVGELPYLWSDENDALLVPPNDADRMAKAIKRILTEPGLSGRLSQNARSKAEGFDWSVILPLWEELFNVLLTGRS